MIVLHLEMDQTKDIVSRIGSLIISTIGALYNIIQNVLTTIGPLILGCPYIILVIIALYLLPILTYAYSDYAIILFYIPATWIIAIGNVWISIYDILAPVVVPIYALYYNTLWNITLLVIQAIYKFACPNNFPPVDLNADCPAIAKVITMVTAYIDAVQGIISSILKVIVQVLNVAGPLVPHAARATCSTITCSQDEWTGSIKIIIAWLMDLIDWLLNGILPIVFLTIGFIADMYLFVISQLIAILLQRVQFLVGLFGNLITLLVPHNPDSVPNKTTDPNGYDNFVMGAVQFLQVNQTITENASGPQELKDFYLTILQLTSDIITTIYDLVMGFIQAFDKGWCYFANFGSCVIKDSCVAVFSTIHLSLFCDKLPFILLTNHI